MSGRCPDCGCLELTDSEREQGMCYDCLRTKGVRTQLSQAREALAAKDQELAEAKAENNRRRIAIGEWQKAVCKQGEVIEDLRQKMATLRKERDAWHTRFRTPIDPGNMTVILEMPPETYHFIRPRLDRFLATDDNINAHIVMNAGPQRNAAREAAAPTPQAPDILSPPQMTTEVRGAEVANQEQP